MRRILGFFAFTLILGAALPALAQTSYQYTQQPYQQQYQQPQLGQATPYGQPPGRPNYEERRGRRDALRVLSAWYGYGNRACDAERAVERICANRDSCTVPVTNRLCGDPAPQIVKVLTVTYTCRGRERTITRGEGGYLGLRCDGRR